MPVISAFTLRGPDDWRRLVALVREFAGPMASRGTPMHVVVAQKHASRRMELNAFMWAGVLEQIAQQVCIKGRWFSPEAFHEQLKRECLPEICSKGISKWVYHADGTRSLRMSTADLDDQEFVIYLTEIQAHAACEWGVEFRDRDQEN